RRWMLGGGTTALTGAVAGGWWLHDRLAPLAPGERVIELPLPSDPLAHGFRAWGDIAYKVLFNSDSSGYEPAIRLVSTDQGSYYYPLSRAQIRATNGLGWKMDFEARVEEGQIIAEADIPGAPQRYTVNVFATSNQPDTVRLLTGITPIRGIDLPLTGPPGARHRYRLEFQGAAAMADLWVDGVKRFTGYRGLSEFRDYRGVEIGANRYHSVRGAGIFSSFRFEIG
ncbi:MAG TPA: hypothetical protein VKE70_37960, partial [Candidatus Solibacter sp.]|nr:hypothetical protein [Candidatus Solibacter sp.]